MTELIGLNSNWFLGYQDPGENCVKVETRGDGMLTDSFQSHGELKSEHVDNLAPFSFQVWLARPRRSRCGW